MKIFDMHVHAHASNTAVEPEKLLSQLEKAGVWGCAVISNRPTEMSIQRGTDFDARLNEVLSLTKGYEDRLVPILWVRLLLFAIAIGVTWHILSYPSKS